MNRQPDPIDEEASGDAATDRRLLRQFIGHDDENAFAELVSRYCGLVMGVCRRFSHNEQAAEDAFQATFLVLARRASKVRNAASLAGWLYAVAYRTARRANGQRHRRREEALHPDMTSRDDTLAQVATRYEQQLLDEELNLLPEQYREPLVLRYLMGKSNKEVAAELGLAIGVVEGRLKRGKDRLRVRLARRGVGLTLVLAAAGSSTVAAKTAVGEMLIANTIATAAAFRHGVIPSHGHSQTALHLAHKELVMTTSTATTSTVATVVLAAGLALGLASVDRHDSAYAQPPQLAAAAPAASGSAEKESPAVHATPTVKPAANDPFGPAPQTASPFKAMGSPPYGAPPTRTPKADDPYGADPQTAALLKALEQPTKATFLDTPLPDVLSHLGNLHKISIRLDTKSLAAAGIAADSPVTRNVKGIPLKKVLDDILDDLGLTYRVAGGELVVTAAGEMAIDEPATFDLVQRGAAERKIFAALEETTQLEFIEQPLQDVVDFFKNMHNIEVQLDLKALDDVGLASDTPITRTLTGLSLDSALDLLLRDLDLTYVVTDEVLLITTPEVAESILETHVYSLETFTRFEPEELAQAIENTILSDSWESSGGPGSIVPLPDCLVITQTQQAHKKIVQLLDQLQKLPAVGQRSGDGFY